MNDEPITETSMHHLICAMCDNAKCVRGTKECEFEKWKMEMRKKKRMYDVDIKQVNYDGIKKDSGELLLRS